MRMKIYSGNPSGDNLAQGREQDTCVSGRPSDSEARGRKGITGRDQPPRLWCQQAAELCLMIICRRGKCCA